MVTIWIIINSFLTPVILLAKFIGVILVILYFMLGMYLAYKCHNTWHEAMMEPEDHKFLRWIFFPIKTFRGDFGISGKWYGEERPDFYLFLILCTFLWPAKIIVDLGLAAILYPIFKYRQHKNNF